MLLRKVLCYFVRFCVTSEGFVLLRKVIKTFRSKYYRLILRCTLRGYQK